MGILIPLLISAQVKEIGLPFINNYSRELYQAGTQNWSIAQDGNGFMYFANNNGVLRYDGNNWQLFPLPNKSIVRIVSFIEGKLYAGGFDEFGYFNYDVKGEFKYTSLSAKLPEGSKEFDEIWRIHSTRYGIVFQSFQRIFLLSSDEIHEIKPKSRFGFSYYVDNNLFVVDRKYGLYILQGESLKPLYLKEDFFMENEVTFIFSTDNNTYLLGTTNNGIYIYDGLKLYPWKVKVNDMFIKNQIYSATRINSSQIAIGSIQNGVYIINKEGTIVQHINRFKGIQNNTVLSLFFDRNKNLWLGLDNGIDLVEISSPFSILNYCFNIETVYTSIIHNNILYVGTNQGLFAKNIKQIKNESLISSGFELIEGTMGQVWKLKVIGNQLLCGHNLGTFEINSFISSRISDIQGGWDYISVPWDQNYMIGGTYSGLTLYQKSGNSKGKWQYIGLIEGFSESSREISFDKEGNLWIAHDYKGLYKLTLTKDLKKVERVKRYKNTRGLPALPYTLTKVRDNYAVVTSNGLYTYSEINDTFLRNDELNSTFNIRGNINRITEDDFGDVWFFTGSNMGVFRLLEDGGYTEITVPFNRIWNQNLSNAFENIYSYDQENVFIGGQKGLLHYNSKKNKDFNNPYETFINKIKIKKATSDSLVIDYYGLGQDELDTYTNVFSYANNSISFGFTSTFFEVTNHIMYSYRLKGFDNNWSDWNDRLAKEYTNLREGNYAFQVKAKNIYDNESNIVTFSFSIKPPIYRSMSAYILYAMLIMAIIIHNTIYFKRRIEKTRRTEIIKHERLLISKEKEFEEEFRHSEEQIEQLKTEKLKIDVKHKNMELANTTMHLIQKNKFLTRIKGDLKKIEGDTIVDEVKSEIKKIVRKIDKDLKNEQYWQVFDKYFEEVYQDFLVRLKEKHEFLTPNDRRLCAYLRMNLSTKEIAPLMNISIRGLEISRYRLRKKLNLDRNTNLVEYILNI